MYVCVSKLCVSKLCVKGKRLEQERTGVHNQRRDPHTKTWGIKIPLCYKICCQWFAFDLEKKNVKFTFQPERIHNYAATVPSCYQLAYDRYRVFIEVCSMHCIGKRDS